jgi:hypothetical protein
MRRVLEWNGRDLPAALRDLAPGRYRLEDEREVGEDEREGLRKLAARCEDARVCD